MHQSFKVLSIVLVIYSPNKKGEHQQLSPPTSSPAKGPREKDPEGHSPNRGALPFPASRVREFGGFACKQVRNSSYVYVVTQLILWLFSGDLLNLKKDSILYQKYRGCQGLAFKNHHGVLTKNKINLIKQV
jgi:hypothetical protein